MALAPADRLAFSLQIVGAAGQIAGLTAAKAQLATAIAKAQSLDTANMNLFTPVNALVTSYQTEYGMLDGNLRTAISEQNIQDAANRILQNYFFPNDTNTTVPSLSASHNIWTKVKPYALNYAIGKSYGETYGTTPKEPDSISAITTLIASTSVYTDLELTTGQSLSSGTCSLPSYTDSASCTAHGGTWTPGSLGPDSTIHTILNNMKTAVNALKTFLTTEAAAIVTTDTASPNQSQNAAAVSNINTVIIPALNTWLAYPDFESTGAGPSKMHSTQMGALSSALAARSTYITTRLSQLLAIVGTISQDLSTGELISSSGVYGKRYGYIVLRLNALGGSLSQLVSMKTSANAQDSIIASIKSTKATYLGIVPTSALGAPGNGTATISAADASMFSVGDTVYVAADNQPELQRAVKSINGNSIVLNDIVPAKYVPSSNARIYKDIS